ncbi:gibberellin 20 oxidase 2-like [Cucurbita pepo subsp. pepo]|uniref:gibberellin 20 oxidase 2-like n=1 Tax=Cucurbita pepo subsp. pepo TaxID=3664 RepID=UPI000C9D35FC|nr:gibberellin 20 oxidase 2-like [Cucurbita pepo subsp. pepo]
MAIKCMTTAKSQGESKLKQEMKRKHRVEFGSSDESMVPENFIWPEEFKARESVPELQVPHIDLQKFMSENENDIEEVRRLVDEACRKHGFFVLVNHGVDMELMKNVHECMDEFFSLPLDVKQKAQRKVGENYGYANSFIGRFSSKLPWKETFSLRYAAHHNFPITHDYVCHHLGQEFSQQGKVYEECGKALSDLSLKIVELLGLSLGLPKQKFKKFFEDNDSIIRLNYYPPCNKPELTLGTGPHCDPTSITILHQDHVSGLQVYVDDQWHSIPPIKDSFVINIGDTFMALTNGVYKSCFHRAVVNCREARKSIVFFLCPAGDKVVRAPDEIVDKNPPRKFPDYTWPMLLELTQKFYRSDSNTFKAFTTWLQHKNLATTASSLAPSL